MSQMSVAALDTAAVRAMVSVVGNYTLDALLDSELRAQHKQQCAERLMMNVGLQVQYAEQAVLANLDWGIDALEEAIGLSNYDAKVARLAHAEKMLQVCALLDTRVTTAGVPNHYLSAWAHLNLAFVWKLRGNDRQAAYHMLEMFFVDPFYSRVDFAPALWEHLFLPHLPNVVNWYTKQRQNIVVSGTPRNLSEEYEMSLSLSTSKDFTAWAKDLQVNVLNLSENQTSHLQALEKLYQDSLDENTRQYAKYYKDWLNCDLENKRGLPVVPIAQPQMPNVWAPPTYGVPLVPKVVQASAGVPQVPAGPQQQKIISASLSRHPSALQPLEEFKGFDNPEFDERPGLPANTRNGIQDDPDSPNSYFRRSVRDRHFPVNIAMSTMHSEVVQPESIVSNLVSEVSSSRKPSRPANISAENTVTPIRSHTTVTPPLDSMVEGINTEYASVGSPTQSDMMNSGMSHLPVPLQTASSRRRRGKFPGAYNAAAVVPHDIDDFDCCNPSVSSPRTVDTRSFIEQNGNHSPSPSWTSPDNAGEIMGDGTASSPSSSSMTCIYTSSSESNDAKMGSQTRSELYDEPGLDFSNGTRLHRESVYMFNNKNRNASPSPRSSREGGSVLSFQGSTLASDGDFSDGDSSDFEAQSAPVQQDPISEPRPKEFSNSSKLITPVAASSPPGKLITPVPASSPPGKLITPVPASSPPGSLRFVSRNHIDDAADSEASLDPGCGRSLDDANDYDDFEEGSCRILSPPASVGRSIPRAQSIPIVQAESPADSSASASNHTEDHKYSKGRHHRGHRRSDSLESVASSSSNSTRATSLMRPPKDFVCPITGQLFHDPVTLETGQTFERKAIQEWLHRGNKTCPITRQMLTISSLPKTNYVLKRLVDSFKEQHPELAMEFGCSSRSLYSNPSLSPTRLNKPSLSLSNSAEGSPEPHSPSSVSSVSSMNSSEPERPTRRFSKRIFARYKNVNNRSSPTSPVNVDALIMNLKIGLACLCLSEDLAECESVILDIAGLFHEARGNQKMVAILNKAGVIDGMIDVLTNSTQVEVLNATLLLLSSLICRDDMTRQTVINADPQLDCLIGLLRTGVTLSVVVLYQLRLPIQQLTSLDLLPLLVMVIKQTEENQVGGTGHGEEDLHSLIIRPKSAAVMLLEQIVTGEDQATFLKSGQILSALHVLPTLISNLNQVSNIDERTSVVSLLLCCMQSDGRCRNVVAQMSNLAPVVELLHNGNNRARKVAISFFNDLVRLNRRAFCNDILQTVKAEGFLSSMHVMLVHLQMAPLEQRPVAASLLLQLDLLEEPCRRSMYRDEALDSLVEALTSTDRPCPAEAANTLLSLSGRFSYSGKPMMEAWLLKTAGLEKSFLTFMNDDQDFSEHSVVNQDEEEKTAKVRERRMAGVLAGHELGAIIEALGQGIQSKNPKVSKQCMVVATWLTHLLPTLPDTGIRQTARDCLLDHFVGVLQTSKDLHQRVLAALAIHSFISDPEGVQELLSYVKDISGPLRQLKKSTWVARSILQAFTTHADANSPDLWVHMEQGQVDTSAHGQVRALLRAGSCIFSGHSDGTIKVWNAKRFPVILQDCKEHSKSVTALTLGTSDRLYSGSLDKSIRVWALEAERIRCVHVVDLKDAVVGLVITGPMACIIPHGSGVKVQCDETATKTLNSRKHVQSLAVSGGRMFCGCTDNSVQEIDPISGSVDSIQHGVRTLLAKKSIYAIQAFQGHLYVAGSPVDGIAGKVWKMSDFTLVGSLCTTIDVRSMVISEDFIYLGSSSGVIEVWLRERLLKVSTLSAGSKVKSLMLDGDTLYSGSEDGKIRAWNMM